MFFIIPIPGEKIHFDDHIFQMIRNRNQQLEWYSQFPVICYVMCMR